MQKKGSPDVHLDHLIHVDMTLSNSIHTKIMPLFMDKAHYSTLLSWMFEHMEKLQLKEQTMFRAKQTLDLYLASVDFLSPELYQLAAFVSIRVAWRVHNQLTQKLEGVDYPVDVIVWNSADKYSLDQINMLEAQLQNTITSMSDNLHSPYTYLSNSAFLGLISNKFNEVFSLLVHYVSTHPNSFGLNSLSIVLAIVEHFAKTHKSTLPESIIQSLGLSESLRKDCETVQGILKELNEENEEADASATNA